MAKYILVEAKATRPIHEGLKIQAWYKQEPDNPFEKPIKLNIFNKWPPIVIDGEMVEYKLDGIYAYPNGTRTREIRRLCIRQKDGTFANGFAPSQQIARALAVLRRVGD